MAAGALWAGSLPRQPCTDPTSPFGQEDPATELNNAVQYLEASDGDDARETCRATAGIQVG